MEKTKRPVYAFTPAKEGTEDIQPSKREMSKTMEVTETFTYYDALAYCMKIEKAIEDKEKEIEGLMSMRDAYRKELTLIEEEFDIVKADEEFHANQQKKLQAEEAAKEVK